MVRGRAWIVVVAALAWLAALGWEQAGLAGPAPATVSYATVSSGSVGFLT
ncbi:MAG: hypothetical protein HYV08_16005, partial [Deltaproteobacteria bacterium]|nr:hypothetical protein [Deltaproteobacteria bacterium]